MAEVVNAGVTQGGESGFCCPKPIRGFAVRITHLDEKCDRPVNVMTTRNSQISTAGFTSMGMSPDIEQGETFTKKLANGDLCVNNNEDCDRLKGLTLSYMLCDIGPHSNELLMGAPMLDNPEGQIVGSGLPGLNFNGSCPPKSTIEIWSGNEDPGQCDENGERYRYVRWILPKTFKWQLSSDVNISNELMDWELSGYAENNPNWVSPYVAAGGVDPDLSEAAQEAIRTTIGPLAWVCTNEIPDLYECNFSNAGDPVSA